MSSPQLFNTDMLANTGFTRCEMVILGGTVSADASLLSSHLETVHALGATWFDR